MSNITINDSFLTILFIDYVIMAIPQKQYLNGTMVSNLFVFRS